MQEDVKKNQPKDLIGKGEQKAATAAKVVEKDSAPLPADPYGGKLKKTNYLLMGLMAASAVLLVLGVVLILVQVVSCISHNLEFTFAKIKIGLVFSVIGFVVLVGSCILKAVVEAKRRENYSSTYEAKRFETFVAKERTTASAKKGKSTTENELTIEDTHEGYKFCPHCRQRIPESSGMFCPRCGKRLDISPNRK